MTAPLSLSDALDVLAKETTASVAGGQVPSYDDAVAALALVPALRDALTQRATLAAFARVDDVRPVARRPRPRRRQAVTTLEWVAIGPGFLGTSASYFATKAEAIAAAKKGIAAFPGRTFYVARVKVIVRPSTTIEELDA